MLFLLTGCFYLVPVKGPFQDGGSVARLAASVVALSGFALVLRLQARAVRAKQSSFARIEALLTALYLLVVVFALIYERIAASTQGQFNGIVTRTDALYFTVTTLATVGFGDIYAEGTAARALVTVQMLFDLVYVGTALRVISGLTSLGGTFSRPGTSAPSPVDERLQQSEQDADTAHGRAADERRPT